MKKKLNKLISMMLVLSLLAVSLIGCGNTASPAVGDEVVVNGTEESTVENTESTMPPNGDDAITTVESDTESTNETSIEDDVVAGASGEEKPAVTASPEPTATPNPTSEPTSTPSPSPEPTPEPHVHEYVETITRKATCAEPGEKQLVCQGCGDSKTEVIPATGEHNWVEETTILHHEALGHVSEVQVQVGTTASYTTYACSACGAEFNSPSEKTEHCASFVPDPHGMASTIMYDHPGEPIYETQSQWIEDTPAWDEQIVVNYKCSTCGATK